MRASTITLPWTLQPLDDPRDQGVAAQVGQLGGQVGSQGSPTAEAGPRAAGREHEQHPVLQVGDELGQDPHRPARDRPGRSTRAPVRSVVQRRLTT